MKSSKHTTHRNWEGFILHIASPVVLALFLFNLLVFMIIIPSMKQNIIERKKETIKEITLTIISEFKDLHRQENLKILTLEKAQKLALEQIENLRFGSDGKDYFWVTDMYPKMMMHPYRKDLNGQDVTHYSDPSGKRLFFEFVNVVKAKNEGYVDYLWQWKDDSKRIVPKLSFVKAFEPWGWVIGTGIYLEDVEEEISKIIRKVIIYSIVILAFVALLLFYIAGRSFSLELDRQRASKALMESEEKYRILVESSSEGMILTIDNIVVYANKTMLQMLDYQEKEVMSLTLDAVMTGKAETDNTRLIRKDGSLIKVIMTSSNVTIGGKNGFIHTAKYINELEKKDDFLSVMLDELQTSLLMPNSPVKEFMIKPVVCTMDTLIIKAIKIMTESDSSAILIKAAESSTQNKGENNIIGIVTDKDIRKRVVLGGVDVYKPISMIMTSPVLKISDNALLYEVTQLLQKKGIHNLAVEDGFGNIIGLITMNEVLQTQRHPASIMIKSINEANTKDQIIKTMANLPVLVKALLDNGAKIENITRTLSLVSDAVISKFVEFAIERLGSAPSRFAFVVFGSEARGEQTLSTDQDNGIIYADSESKANEDYFLRLGNLVCDWLNEAGYLYCKGEVMARNPKWCQPLSKWKTYFTDCVNAINPNELLDVNVFFDFKVVCGVKDFVDELKQHLFKIVEGNNEFYFHLAQGTLQYKPPLGFFGNIQLKNNDATGSTFNIKSAIIPIVNFTRIYALDKKVKENNTFLRLHCLQEKEILMATMHNELKQALACLMEMRMHHQSRQITKGLKPDNYLSLNELTHIEQSLLKKIFSNILVFQSRLTRDYARTE